MEDKEEALVHSFNIHGDKLTFEDLFWTNRSEP